MVNIETLWGSFFFFNQRRASLVAQLVKNLPAMWETWVHSWVGKIPWRKEQLPTPVFCPGEFHGQRTLAGYSTHEVIKSWIQLSDFHIYACIYVYAYIIQIMEYTLTFKASFKQKSCFFPITILFKLFVFVLVS